ncbi:hypothetical protein ABZ345_46595 [Lentzea sp. NPDC005914]|uniref:hypothetical protein n=1 Tax=Lentzea sp. NPDC005914 TaxID=3154572 RepID=UPI0033D86F48
MTTPEDQFSSNERRIAALRDDVIERAEDLREDAEALAASPDDAHSACTAEELHRYDDVEDVNERHDLRSGMDY